MKRTPSSKKKSRSAVGDEATLTKYFRPRTQTSLGHDTNNKESIQSPLRRSGRTHPKNEPEPVHSSSEDELSLLDHLLPSKQAEKSQFSHVQIAPTPTSSHKQRCRRSESPESAVPTFAGSFNLSALLADRVGRTSEKEFIARLDDTDPTSESGSQGQDKPGTKTGQATRNESVQRLLRSGKDGASFFWSIFEDLPAPLNLDLFEQSLEWLGEMPRVLHITTKEDLDACINEGTLTLFIELRGRDVLPASLFPHLVFCLLSSPTPAAVMRLSRILAKLPCFDFSLLLKVNTVLGIPDLDHEPGQSIFFRKEKSPDYGRIRIEQWRGIVSSIDHSIRDHLPAMEKTQQGAFVDEAARLAMLLAGDDCLGFELVAELEKLMSTVWTERPGSLHVYACLDGLGLSTDLQVRIARAIPTSTEDLAQVSAQMATVFFLNLKPEYHSGISSQAVRLRLLVEYISSNAVFATIGSSTDYIELTSKLALLSIATASVPTNCGTLVSEMVERLQKLHGQIVDSKAAFLDRSEAKASIQRLADRLKYTLEAQSRKRSVFAAFK